MDVEKYDLRAESDRTTFEFVSKGPKGLIIKVIDFQYIGEPNLYNLAFGDKNSDTGVLDDLSVSDNGDSEKVLVTVVAALYRFFDNFPDAFVYAMGSANARNRLYRMGITRYFEQMNRDFSLLGQKEEGFEEFEIGKDYEGFLARRKF